MRARGGAYTHKCRGVPKGWLGAGKEWKGVEAGVRRGLEYRRLRCAGRQGGLSSRRKQDKRTGSNINESVEIQEKKDFRRASTEMAIRQE